MLIIHGDDIVNSRRELEQIKKENRDKEICILENKSLNLEDIKSALEARSLFGLTKLIIIEKLFSLAKSKKRELNYLASLNNPPNLVLWESKEIGKTALSLFRKAKVKLFKLQRILFTLMDSLIPKNSKTTIHLYRNCLQNNTPELILSMIIRQFRLLILVKSLSKKGPVEYQKLIPWQRQKLTNQAKLFSMNKLEEIYKSLLEIDYKNKTGKAVFDLEKSIEMLIMEI